MWPLPHKGTLAILKTPRKIVRNRTTDARRDGAENGIRTRDTKLGKLVLYQLSYFRPLPNGSIYMKRFTCQGNKVGAQGEVKYFQVRLPAYC